MQIPLVKKVTEVLDGQIIRVDAGFGTAAKPTAANEGSTEDADFVHGKE
jgi:hypothetical protein